MPNTTPQPNPANVDGSDVSDLPPLVDQESEPEPTSPPQQVFVTYWANAPHPPRTVVSISYIIENGKCVVVPVLVNVVEQPVLRMIIDNCGVQFRRQNDD